MWTWLDESWKNWLVFWSFVLGGLFLSGCQGAPAYQVQPSKADNSVHFRKGATSAEGDIVFGADTDGYVKDFKVVNRNGTETRIGELKFTQDKSGVLNASVNPMDAYVRQQAGFNMILQTHGANAIGILGEVGKIIDTIAPIAGQYINARMQVALNKRPLIEQLSGLISNGLMDRGSVAAIAEPDVMAAVDARLSANSTETAALKQQIADLQRLVLATQGMNATTRPSP